MAIENSGFDAGKFYDEGVEQAGLNPEEAVTDSPGEGDSTNVSTQVTEKGDTDEPSKQEQEPAAETKPDENQEPSTEEDVKAAIESTEEAEQEVESVIAALLPDQQAAEASQQKTDFEPGKYVPVGDHAKLRESRRSEREGRIAAERERDELRQQIEASTQTGGVKPGEEAEKSPLEKFVEENPDEDLVPAKVQLDEQKFHEARRQKTQAAKEKAEQSERAEQEKQYRTTEAIRAISAKALKSETEVRKANPDYDAVTKPIIEADLLTDANRVEFLRDANPAQKLYEICKAKAEAIRGITGTTNTTAPDTKTTQKEAPATKEAETPGEKEDLTDQEIFDEVKELFHPDEEE